MSFALMLSQCLPCSKSLFAEVAWNEDAFQMIGFDVIFYVSTLSLLSTYFAHKSKLTSAITILAFLHQRFHLFIKLSQIHR